MFFVGYEQTILEQCSIISRKLIGKNDYVLILV